MLPVRDAGEHPLPEVREDGLHGLAVLRRSERQPGRDLAGLDLGAHGIALHVAEIVGHPVHEGVGVPPELFRVHGSPRRRGLGSRPLEGEEEEVDVAG